MALKQLGGIGVLIFFFVSGYGLYASYGNRNVDKGYIVKRLKGVYFPYVLMKLAFLAGYYILGILQEFSADKLFQIITIEDWFIHVIVLQYILFYVFAKFFNRQYLILYSFGADIVLSIIFIFESRPIGWFNALWLFTVGMFAEAYKTEIIRFYRKHTCLKICIMLALFALIGLAFAVNKGVMWANAVKPAAGIFLCLAICGIFRFAALNSGILKWSGRRSMYLYIVHLTVWKYTVSITKPAYRWWLTVILTVLLTELLYRAITKLMDKMSALAH